MAKSPLVIVGTGGSGTRAFARLVEAGGRSMGAHQNEANDAMALFRFANKWCPRVYAAWQAGAAVDHASFRDQLEPCLEAHLETTDPGAPWGWKQPRSLYMLPALSATFPDLRVVHVLRDGRDIAFGKQFRLSVASDYAVPGTAAQEPAEVKLAIMWSKPNSLAADFGEARLGERYLRLRLEDLCAAPVEAAGQLVDFAEGEPVAAERIHSIVNEPPTLGRWRGQEPTLLARVQDAAGDGLKRFDYADSAIPANPALN